MVLVLFSDYLLRVYCIACYKYTHNGKYFCFGCYKEYEDDILNGEEWIKFLMSSERKARRHAAKGKEVFNPIYLGDKFDLTEGNEGYRLVPREDWYGD